MVPREGLRTLHSRLGKGTLPCSAVAAGSRFFPREFFASDEEDYAAILE
jgi:hypothetical protein